MSAVPRIPLGDGYTISSMLVGGWQLSHGHRVGAVDEESLFAELTRMARAGLTTFDCADIYTGVEELLGRFATSARSDLAQDGLELQIHTKYVPDRDALATLNAADVERAIDRSLRRLQTDRLDLVQLAWWDYEVPGYVEAAHALNELRLKGKIRHVGATNFDVPRMREMLDAGVPLVSNQVQYSLLDRRPEHGMAALAGERDIGLLCYGSLAGGFLSERWAGVIENAVEATNRSLVKYRLIIDEAGGWDRHQALLETLGRIAERHGVPIPCVAMRWVLDRPTVSGVIVGTYHGGHLHSNLRVFELELGDEDRQAIEDALKGAPGPAGDVFGLERVPGGPHARIMWTNLNREA